MLEACLQSADTEGAELQAHTIKGAAASVGGEVLRGVAFEMEKAAQVGDLDTAKKRMKALAAAFKRLRQLNGTDTLLKRLTEAFIKFRRDCVYRRQ